MPPPIRSACSSHSRALEPCSLGFRAAGSAAGWGFQFQSPVFVASMAWLFFLVGLESVGGLRGRRQLRRGRELIGWKSGPSRQLLHGISGRAGGDALHRAIHGSGHRRSDDGAPPATTLAVFLTLGLGLAAPYALLAISPRPGQPLAEARAMDGGPEAGARLSDVRRRRLARLGAQPSGGLGRRAGGRDGDRAARASRPGPSAPRKGARGARARWGGRSRRSPRSRRSSSSTAWRRRRPRPHQMPSRRATWGPIRPRASRRCAPRGARSSSI